MKLADLFETLSSIRIDINEHDLSHNVGVFGFVKYPPVRNVKNPSVSTAVRILK